jgi:WD40 repeat protein
MQNKNRLISVFFACSCGIYLTACSLIGTADSRQIGVAQAIDTPTSQDVFAPLFVSPLGQVIEPVNASSLSPSSVLNYPAVNSFVWLPDDQGAALAGDESIFLLSTTGQPGASAQADTPELTQTITTPTPSLLYAAQEAAILAWVSDGKTIQILDHASGSDIPLVLKSPTPVTGLALTPSGDYLAYATFDHQVVTQQTGEDSSDQYWSMPAWLVNLSYSPDARQLAGADLANFRLYFLNASNGEVLRSLEWSESATSALYGVYLSPDWGQAAWVSQGAVQLMDVKTGKTGPLLTHPDVVRSIAWSPDSQLLATGSAAMDEGKLEPAVLLWDASSGRLLHTLIQLEPVQSLAFSPDGRQLAVLTTNGNLQTWSVSR